MRKLVLLALLSAIGLAGVSSTAEAAYYLDTPHNESNGIYCYTCHVNNAWWWTGLHDPAFPADPDAT
ncbi:MAG: hypothetical protein KJ950_11895, partial [Proteobacteria bacterium]|nr:hypothetical protein [Pseudomonadota bacterium]MBU1688033.1 hypothetical protein [Pseudomonadota bacterium]